MNTDRLSMAPAFSTLQTAYAAVSAMDTRPAPEQVAALGVLFVTVCEEAGLEVGQQVDAARRRLRHATEHLSNEERALRGYVRTEILAR